MSNTSSPRCSAHQHSVLIGTAGSLEHLLHASSPHLFKKARRVPYSETARATTKIDLLGPLTTLKRVALQTKFDDINSEAEGTVHTEGHSDIDDYQTNKEHGYDMDIHQLVQAEIAALDVSTQAKIRLIIVHNIFDNQANHLFPVLREQMEVAIEDPLETGLLGNNEPICLKLKAVVFKDVENMIRNNQANVAIHPETRRTVESESWVKDIFLCIVKDNTVVKSFATHTKRHVNKAWDDWQVTKIWQNRRRNLRPCETCFKIL